MDKKIEYQVDKLLRAAVTINQGTEVLKNRQKEDNLRYKPNLSNFDTKRVTDKPEEPQEETLSEEDQRSINSDEIDSEELEKYTVARQKAQAKRRPQKEEPSEESDAEIYKAVKTNPVSMIDKKSKSLKKYERESKRMGRVDLVREMKHDMLGLPDEVNYGVNGGNKLLVEEDREDEQLEMKYFKRINYTKKEMKEREKRRQKLGKSDYSVITDGYNDFKRIEQFMNMGVSDEEENEKQFERQRFLQEVRGRKRDKKGKRKGNEEIDSDEAGDISFKNIQKCRLLCANL